MGAFAVATGLAARTDAVHAAAHQIAFQLWLASSLLADSLAVAGQSLIARELAHGDARGRRYATDVVSRVTNLSLLLGMALATGLTVGCYILPLPRLFSSDMEVMSVLGLLLPAVIATQPLNALAFTLDGVLYGVNGFKYAAGAMIASALPAVAAMLLGMQAAGALGWTFDGRLLVVWGGLALLMFLRFATIMVPLRNLWPPFDKLRP